MPVIIDTGGQIYTLLNKIIATQTALESQMSGLADQLAAADTSLQTAVAALVPLINTAITMLGTMQNGGSVPDAEVTQVITDLSNMAATLNTASTSLSGAETPTPPPAS